MSVYKVSTEGEEVSTAVDGPSKKEYDTRGGKNEEE
jgi:hypothetical protein